MKYKVTSYGKSDPGSTTAYGVHTGDPPNELGKNSTMFAAVFPCHEFDKAHQALQREHANKFCAYLNEREEAIEAATKAMTVAARLGE